jgi:hypothetical protein
MTFLFISAFVIKTDVLKVPNFLNYILSNHKKHYQNYKSISKPRKVKKNIIKATKTLSKPRKVKKPLSKP